jgi:hypothetical protein
MQHMHELKGSVGATTIVEEMDENKAATKERTEPTVNEDKILTQPFVVDLLTQEDRSVKPPPENWWVTAGLNQWMHVFQARSTEEGMDLFVDQEALREVAGSLLRDLTTKKSEKSAAENCGTEY